MPESIRVRASTPADIDALGSIYPAAFPDEDLLPLVRSLLTESKSVVSLVATIEGQVAGHVIFTNCGVTGSDIRASLLGPLAIAPARQRQGIGTTLVRAGLQELKQEGVNLVCVLGDPAYYSRHGFEVERSVQPPYPLPVPWNDAWRSHYLGDIRQAVSGKLRVPPQWSKPALWGE